LGLALTFAVGLALFFAQAGAAQTEPPPSDDQVNAIAKGLYCPVCENIPLDVCPTQACFQWRELIREKLAAGWSEQQIKDYFVTQYCDRVLAEPPARGLNWLVYVLPPIGFVLGGVVLYLALRNMRKNARPEPPVPSTESTPGNNGHEKDEYLARLEEELRRRQE
jgi:cytochrome c-type biogenesis protein CcmH